MVQSSVMVEMVKMVVGLVEVMVKMIIIVVLVEVELMEMGRMKVVVIRLKGNFRDENKWY